MNTTANYLSAAAALLEAGIAQMEPEAIEDVRELIRDGAMVQIQTAFGRAGHVGTSIVLIGPAGDRLEILGLELADGRH